MTAPFPAPRLPHVGYARFVEEVVESGDDVLVCIGRIPSESPFAQDGLVPGFVLMELAAQAAAIEVLAGMGGTGPRPRIGYLVRAHGANWIAEGVPVDAPLRASVRREGSVPPLYIYRGTVTLHGVEVFGGEFSIYVDDEAG